MTKIHKIKLNNRVLHTIQKHLVHEGAAPLKVGKQGNDIVLWIQQDTSKPMVEAKFVIHFTGSGLDPEQEKYIDTVQIGPLVYHVYSVDGWDKV